LFTVLTCIHAQHDLRLVALAAAICLAAVVLTFWFYRRARRGSAGFRAAWLGLTALVCGTGVWATHFVAMLAFRSGLPVGYEIVPTALSIAVAMAVSALGFAVVLQYGALTLGASSPARRSSSLRC